MLRDTEEIRAGEEVGADIFEQDDVVKARPDIDDKVSSLVSKGRWNVPGYKVRQCRAYQSMDSF